ncbi:30S ribosomal protein S24e [Candidatus Bathyarchaeota archaeon]|jgi:ribosomal protein S24E|nr:30S ribosomal protein S24e [Candidatus Bathyarchaeota archaeon]MDP6049103.1 30S ribosomal protein S24e [Candidatus Bathyarchaeota archaeon]
MDNPERVWSLSRLQRRKRSGLRTSYPEWRKTNLKTNLKSTKDNPLLGRREITFEIREQSTPSRAKVRRELAVLMKVELDRVWVRNIETKKGTHTTVGLVHVYQDPENAILVEPDYIIKRNQKPEAVAKSEEQGTLEPEANKQESEK